MNPSVVDALMAYAKRQPPLGPRGQNTRKKLASLVLSASRINKGSETAKNLGTLKEDVLYAKKFTRKANIATNQMWRLLALLFSPPREQSPFAIPNYGEIVKKFRKLLEIGADVNSRRTLMYFINTGSAQNMDVFSRQVIPDDLTHPFYREVARSRIERGKYIGAIRTNYRTVEWTPLHAVMSSLSQFDLALKPAWFDEFWWYWPVHKQRELLDALYQVTRMLLENKANVYADDVLYQLTPLHAFMTVKRPSVHGMPLKFRFYRLLKEHGADFKGTIDFAGRTPVDVGYLSKMYGKCNRFTTYLSNAQCRDEELKKWQTRRARVDPYLHRRLEFWAGISHNPTLLSIRRI